jgi:signal transduction histidine kinase
MLVIGSFVLIGLALILLLLFFAYRRSMRLTHNIADANQMLTTERDNLRRIQKELISARDKAKSAEQHKTDFINTISHEVSEPVNAIVGYSQLIVDSVDDKRRASLERFIQIIQLNAQLLTTLVNDVLDVSELENSRIVIKLKNISLKEMCEFSADSVRARLLPGVELNVAPLHPDQQACNIDTDALRAEQVLVNLLSNAVKFTDKGHINVLYGIDKDSQTAKMIVEDTGPGIPKGKERKIFDRFYKGSQVSQGIGLGLPICRLVSRLLGGTVELDTNYTDGARFVFTLPLHKSDKAAHIVSV